MRSPPTFAFADALVAPAADVATQIGPYRLLREIGRGGMASVWLAERADGLLDRQVALKLPHLSWGAASFADRMARERNILASLTHPNIARLYDAGVADDGRPFLALEHVEGESIDRHAAAKGLTVRARVALIVQVARAVAHAHARLVVHRDLKPSNILVDAQGQAHLLDFGIAKLIDPLPGDEPGHAQATQAAGRALTPDYASPEQIRGDAIGTASDIYSLGVVSFELLSGDRPYRLEKHLGAVALAEAIARTEVPRASQQARDAAVRRQLAGDLDAILLRALARHSSERYATMDAFADDLERHLRGEPVSARPDAPWYRAERWVRRHKLETAVAVAIVVAVPAGAVAQAAVLVAIGAGAAVALWQMRLARRQSEVARSEATHAKEVKAFALSIFQAAGTDAGAGAATTATDLLKTAQLRIERELAGRPGTAVELMTVIGEGLFGLGEREMAADVLAKSVDLATRELGIAHRHTPAAMTSYGSVLIDLDRPQEAIAQLVPAIDEARRQRDTHVLIDGLRWLSSCRMRLGEIDAGVALAREAVEVADTSPDTDPHDAMAVWTWMANALNVAERDGVADAARRALELSKPLYGDRFSEALLSIRMMLARGLAAEGQDAQALAELDQVLDETVRFFGPTYPRIEVLYNFRGHVRLDSGDAVGAIADFRAQIEAAHSRGGEGGVNLGLGHGALAKALTATPELDAALANCEQAAEMLREALGPETAHVWRARSVRAMLLARLGRLDEAALEADALEPAVPSFSEIDRAVHAGRVSALRRLQGRHQEAVGLALASIETLRTHPSKVIRAGASATLGMALLSAGRASDALAPLQEAVRLYAEKQRAMLPDHAAAIAALQAAEAAAGPHHPGD